MATIIDKDGNEIEVLTAEEAQASAAAAVAAREAELTAQHEKALADEKAHQAEKLRQLEEARKGAGKAEDEAKRIAEEAQKTANEAKTAIEAAKTETITTKRDYFIRSVTGGDEAMTRKVLENYDLLNMPVGSDTEIQARVQKAIGAAGINSVGSSSFPSMSFAGMGAPAAPAVDQTVKNHNYEVFKNELGIADMIPKPNQNK